MADILITATNQAGEASTIIASEVLNNLVTVEFIYSDESIQKIEAFGEIPEISNTATVLFENTCIPENPMYFKWINSLGGWDYHMFSKRQKIAMKIKSSIYETDSDFVQGYRDELVINSGLLFDSEITTEVTFGCGWYGRFEFNKLLGMLKTNDVQLWDTDAGKWERVVIVQQNINHFTNDTSGEFEATIRKMTDLIKE